MERKVFSVLIDDRNIPTYSDLDEFSNIIDRLKYFTDIFNGKIINENGYSACEVLTLINMYLNSLRAPDFIFENKNRIKTWELNNPQTQKELVVDDQIEIEL